MAESQAEKDLRALREQEKIRDKIAGKKIPSIIGDGDFQKIKAYYGTAEKALAAIKNATEGVRLQINDLNSGLSDFRDLAEAIQSEFSRVDSATSKIGRSFRKISGYASQLTDVTLDMANASTKEVKILKEKTELEFKRLKLLAQKARAEEKDLEKQLERKDLTDKEEKSLRKRLDAAKSAAAAAEDELGLAEQSQKVYGNILGDLKEIDKIAGIGTGLLGGLGAALEKVGFGSISKHFEAGADAARKFSVEAKESIDELNPDKVDRFFMGTMASIKALGIGIKETLFSTLGAVFSAQGILIGGLTLLLKQFAHLDSAVAKTGMSLGLTRDAAHDFAMSIKDASFAAGDTFLNMDRMLEAQTRMSSALGTNVRLTGTQLANQVRLAEFVGLQEEELANVYTATLLTGKSQEDLYNSVVDTNDSIFASNQLFKEAAGVTGQIAVNLGNNPVAIAKAVAQTKRLGINLETARDMAMGTLDFENSIAAEMEAQLLTGKSMNLNRARELAFAGQFEKAAEEMLNQEAVREAFATNNVLAQQAAAEAIGMSVDQLAEAFRAQQRNEKIEKRRQELLREEEKRLGRTLKGEERKRFLGEAQLRALRENQTAGERLSNAFTKIGDKVGSIVAPAVEFVADQLEKALGVFEGLFSESNATTEQLNNMAAPIAEGVKKGEELKLQFKGVVDFVKGIGTSIQKSFDESPILTTLGAIAGGVVTVKAAGKVKDMLGFGELGTEGNPMYVVIKGGGGGGGDSSGGASTGKNLLSRAKDFITGTNMRSGSQTSGLSRVANAFRGGGFKGGMKALTRMGSQGLSSLTGGGLGELLQKGVSKVKDIGSNLNPMKALKDGMSKAGGFSKVMSKVLKFGAITALIDGLFAHSDIKGMVASGARGGELNKMVGARVYETIGSVGGSVLGGILGSAIPGPGTMLGSIAGAYGGPYVMKGLAGLFDPDYSKLGGVVSKMYLPAMAEGGIVSQPTAALIGEAGAEAVIPLKEFYAKMDELINVVSQGGDVMLDGVKVGNTLSMASYKL